MSKAPTEFAAMRAVSPRIASREVRAAAAEMFGNGIGHIRVARTLGLSPNTVRDWLREYRAGKFRVDVSTNQHHFSAEAREAVIAMREAGMSLDAIQKQTGISRSTVLRWLKAVKQTAKR